MDEQEIITNVIKFFSLNNEEKHALVLYNIYNQENKEILKKLALENLYYGRDALYEIVNAGFCYLNNVTVNIVATATFKFFKKYRKMIKQLHFKKFNTKKYIGQNNRLIVGYDGRPDSKRWAELFCKIFYYHDWFVCLTPVTVTASYISYTAAGGLYNYGIYISGGSKESYYNGIKIYFDDGCPMHPPFNDYLNELIKKREFTNTKEEYELENFDFKSSLKYFVTAYPPKIHLIFWKKLQNASRMVNRILTVYCIHNSVRKIIEAGLEYYKLDGMVYFYPPDSSANIRNLEKVNLRNRKKNTNIHGSFHPIDFYDNIITDYADSIRSSNILIIGPEGMRCCFAYKYENQWNLCETEELAALLLKWLVLKVPPTQILPISTYKASNFALIYSYKFTTRYLRLSYFKNDIYGRCYSYSTFCKMKKADQEDPATVYLYFDEEARFLIHSGKESSAAHIAILLCGMDQQDSINIRMHKIRNDVGKCCTITKTFIVANIFDTIENILKPRCLKYEKNLIYSSGMYTFSINSNVSVYITEKDSMIHVIIYFNEINNLNKKKYVNDIINKYLNIKSKKPSIRLSIRKKWLRKPINKNFNNTIMN